MTPPHTVRVYYDFASTICYVAHRVMERMAGDLAHLEIVLEWHPVDLARLTGWQRGATVEGPRRVNALRVADDLGVPVRMPRVWLDSRAAHDVAFALAGTSKEPAWRERVWTAVFEEGLALDTETLGRLGDDLDLSVDELVLAPDRIETTTREAADAGVTGAPTFMLGEWPCGGIQEDATMRSLLDRFVRRRARTSSA